MSRFFILFGYFELSMYLYLSGKLDQYINLHYSYLAFLAMMLSGVLAIVQLIIWMKNLPSHHSLTGSAKYTSLILLALPLFVGFCFPTVSLDSTTVAAKGYHFPLAAGVDTKTQQQEGTTVQYLKPDTSSYFTQAAYQKEMQAVLDDYLAQETITITSENYMAVMEVIYNYPEKFVGKTIQLTGFVYNDPDHEGQQFLFRFGIIHCIADSGVYGLLTTGLSNSYADNTWVKATGTLTITYHNALQQSLPTLKLSAIETIAQPENPYVYRVF